MKIKRSGMVGDTYDSISLIVMAGLVPAIHVFDAAKKDVDTRVKPGHDGG
jgi:hypothetical protein